MSGRGKGGSGISKKAKTASVSDYEFKDGDSVVLVNYCEGDDNPLVTGVVPRSCLEKHLSIWLNNCQKGEERDSGKVLTCEINLSDIADNEQLQEYVKQKDLQDGGGDEDDDIKDDDDEDDEDDELEDVYDLLADIENWVSIFLPEWSNNMPPPSKAIKIVARFGITGSVE